MLQTVLPLVDPGKIGLSSAPWTMHEFFAGSGLVAYGLKGMFAPLWANDICPQKASVYEANFGSEHFLLNDIKNVRGADGGADVFLDCYAAKSKLLLYSNGLFAPKDIFILFSLYQCR